MNTQRTYTFSLAKIMMPIFLWVAASSTYAADHAEFVIHSLLGADVLAIDSRPDAQLTDLYAFQDASQQKLVLILMSDLTAGGQPQSSYRFPSDVTYEINIDNNTRVTLHSDPFVVTYKGSNIPIGILGGTIEEPKKIKEDITIRVRFPLGLPSKPEIDVTGMSEPEHVVLRYAGLCDDPFTATVDGINDVWGMQNRAALVFEVPISDVREDDPLLIWGTSKVNGFEGPFQDIVGHGGYNEGVHALLGFAGALPLSVEMNNGLHPRKVIKKLSSEGYVPPDVLIFEPALPAHYPENGRRVADDAFQALLDAAGIPVQNIPKDRPLNLGNASICPYLGDAWQ